MHDVIFKVTSKEVVRMEKGKNFIDIGTTILILATNTKVRLWDFYDVLETPEGKCIFVYDEKLVEHYKNGLELLEKRC